MNRFLLAYLCLFLIQNLGYSQENNNSINERYTQNSLFLFNSFQNGIAYFNDNRITKCSYTYNVVYDNICYLKDKQIYELTNISKLDSIKINDVTLICNQEKIYEVLSNGKIKTLLQRKANLSASKPEGAYGTSSNTSAVSKKTSINTGKGIWGGERCNIQNESDKETPIANKFFLLINYNLFPAMKLSVNKYFKDQKSEIKTFLSENNINFHKSDDVLKLNKFLGSLN